MRVDVSGIVSGSPTIKGKSASLKLHGGGPFLYAYGQFGDQLVSRLSEGTSILASGSVNYAKDGSGDWQKYINLTGNVTILPNRKVAEKEKAKLTFVTSGIISKITPQQTKSGNMAKFTIDEKIVDFRGENEFPSGFWSDCFFPLILAHVIHRLNHLAYSESWFAWI